MKKLIAALVLTLSTAALAQQEQHQDTQAQQEQKANEGRRIKTGVDATEVGPGLQEAAGLDTAKEGTFSKKGQTQAFNLTGTFKGAAFDGITLARQDLPDADLDVRKQTQVTLDGKKVEVGA